MELVGEGLRGGKVVRLFHGKQPGAQSASSTNPRSPLLISHAATIEYHAEFDGHYYSVPYALAGQVVELRITTSTVERFAAAKSVAVHAQSHRQGAFSTLTEHMPASHQAHRQYGNDRLEAATTPAVTLGAMRYRNVVSILKSGLDRAQLPAPAPTQAETLPGEYENLRGAGYYH